MAICLKCQKNKSHQQTRMPLVVTSVSDEPFDLVGALPKTSNGNKYIPSMVDLDCGFRGDP